MTSAVKLPAFKSVTVRHTPLTAMLSPILVCSSTVSAAIVRTAEALGINGALLHNCCDVYNPKALRASMGGMLRLPFMQSENLAEDIKKYKSQGFSVYAAVPDASAQDITKIEFHGSDICVIGNEGNGVSGEVLAECAPLTINMLGRAESLNASVAGTIVMWEMLR